MLLNVKTQPTIGYKAVTLPNKRWCIAELEIPNHALVYSYGRPLSPAYRTDRVITKKFVSVGRRRTVLPYTEAYSWFDPNFQYTKTQMVTAYLGSEQDAYGIHFFADINDAIAWGNIMLPGCNYKAFK